MLRPGNIGMRGSMVVRLRSCMRSSISPIGYPPPPPGTPQLDVGVAAASQLVEQLEGPFAALLALALRQGHIPVLLEVGWEDRRKKGSRGMRRTEIGYLQGRIRRCGRTGIPLATTLNKSREYARLLYHSSTLLEPQSHFGDRPVKFQVVCPQNRTAVLKGLRAVWAHILFITLVRSLHISEEWYV